MSGRTICHTVARGLERVQRSGFADEFLAPNGAWEIEGEPYILRRLGSKLSLVSITDRGRPNKRLSTYLQFDWANRF